MKTLIMRFSITSSLRYLSHRETLEMFHRAFTRADIAVAYTNGFNPRIRLSLPLPRSVAVAAEDELLCAGLEDTQPATADRIEEEISSQLPLGVKVLSVEIADGKVSCIPLSAVYEFELSAPAGEKALSDAVKDLQNALDSGDGVFVQRDATRSKPVRRIDVSGYIDSMTCGTDRLRVKCNITPLGTVRVDEIMKLLQIDSARLSGPINRTSVQWRRN